MNISSSTFELLLAIRKAKQQRAQRDAVILKRLWKCMRIIHRVAKSPLGNLIAITASVCPVAFTIWFCLWWNTNEYVSGVLIAISATLVMVLFAIFWSILGTFVKQLIVLVDTDLANNSEHPLK
jgi:hypothetical protein